MSQAAIPSAGVSATHEKLWEAYAVAIEDVTNRLRRSDMIDAGLVGRELISELPPDLAARLDALLAEQGA